MGAKRKHVADLRSEGFDLDSPAGTHAVEPLAAGHFRVAMGVPQFAPQAIGLGGFGEAQDEYALDIAGATLRFGAVSMGNPHALVEVDDIAAAPPQGLGMSGHTGFRHYALSVAVASDGQTFIASATPTRAGGQDGDGECLVFSLDHRGRRAVSGSRETTFCWR